MRFPWFVAGMLFALVSCWSVTLEMYWVTAIMGFVAVIIAAVLVVLDHGR